MQSFHSDSAVEIVQADFMNIVHDLHQQESENKKKDKARRRAMARRAIEMHMEKKKLEADIRECWDDSF